MSKVAKQHGYGLSFLRYHFPDECKAISNRRKESLLLKIKLRREQLLDTIRAAVLKFHEQGVYPSKRAVLEQLPKKWYLRQEDGLKVWQGTLQELGYTTPD